MQTLRAELADYARAELICYRASDDDAELLAHQRQHWDSWLDWMQEEYQIGFHCTQGIMPVAQPEAAIARAEALWMRLMAGRYLFCTGLSSLAAHLCYLGHSCKAGWMLAPCLRQAVLMSCFRTRSGGWIMKQKHARIISEQNYRISKPFLHAFVPERGHCRAESPALT